MIADFEEKERREDEEAMAKMDREKQERRRIVLERTKEVMRKENELFAPLNGALVLSEVT